MASHGHGAVPRDDANGDTSWRQSHGKTARTSKPQTNQRGGSPPDRANAGAAGRRQPVTTMGSNEQDTRWALENEVRE